VREPTAPRGRFVTFEGPEGSGKTVQARRLHERARQAGIASLLTHEPGGTPVGERVREILLVARDLRIDPRTDALLFAAARAQHVTEVIEPTLAIGRLVVCARFADSSLAYQGHGRELPLEEMAALQRFATGGLKPDLTILLDLPAEVGLARKPEAERLRFEAAFDLPFHRRVREAYLALAAAEPERFVVVDADASPEVVGAAVIGAVVERLPELAAIRDPGRRPDADRDP